MHQSSLFQQNRQPAIQPFDLNQLATQFAGVNFNLGEPYDKITPQVCVMVMNEIQNKALQTSHPIRVCFFNMISENYFNNQLFNDLVYTIMTRVGYGWTNQEWRSMDMAVNDVIGRVVKACACYLATEDQEFMGGLPEDDRRAAIENAELWSYVVALAQGNIAYIPFNQMGVSNGLSNVNSATANALQAARATNNQPAGGFVEGYNHVTNSRYNNNGGQATGRYGRKAEVIHGKLEGSLQTALKESAAHVTPSYQSRMTKPNNAQPSNSTSAPMANTRSFSQAAAQQFDKDVTDFSVNLDTTQEMEVTGVIEEVKPIFSVPFNNENVDIIRQRHEGYAAWKPSKLQPFHPAWCKRTHTVLYFETSNGYVIAMLKILDDTQKEIAMDYEAHAIDPTKGKPAEKIKPKPVREEAKVLYAAADKVTLNIVVSSTYGMEEETVNAIRTTRLKAQLNAKVPDAMVHTSTINTPIVYDDADTAEGDYGIIKAIGRALNFTEAATLLSQVKNDLAREHLNKQLNDAINRTMNCELGVGVRISNFIEDGLEIVAALKEAKGVIFGDKLQEQQKTILSTTVRAAMASDYVAYANAVLATNNEDEVLEEDTLKRIIFLQRNVCAVWVNYTDDELAIGMPPKGAAPIQSDSLGGLYKIASAMFNEAIGKMPSSQQYLVTKDGVEYQLHKGLLMKEFYLISRNS